METEIATWPDHYGDLKVPVFAPRLYYPLSIKKDEYSKNIVFGKKTDLSHLFIQEMEEIFGQLPFKPDLVIVVPSSKINKFSPTMVNLGRRLSRTFKIKFSRRIKRIEERTKLTDCSTQEERYNSITGCFKVIKKLNYEKVILLDDTRVSGVTLLECAKILKKAGASDIVAVCLGINAWEKK